MRFDEIELRVIRMPYRSAFKTSFASESQKVAVITTVRSDGVEGYGEGVMDPLPMYREETIAGGLGLMRDALVPWLLQHGCLHPSELLDAWSRWRGNSMAKAAVELAVWDCFARQQDVPLCSLLGGRVKLKIEPGWDRELLTAVRSACPQVELTVDANSAYALDDTDLLRSFDEFDLHYIEQPLHWDDLHDHATLARSLRTPICLDESLTSPARVKAALDMGACTVVNVKVGRFGGIESVVRVHDICVERNAPMWCGGMLETGIGRAHNIHLATLPGFVYPGDTASASRTYARDIVEQPRRGDARSRRQWHRRHPRSSVPRQRDRERRGAAPMTDLASLEFRDLVSADQLAVLPPFERRIWGGESELVSVNMLVATVSEGGVAIGAFDGDAIVGAVYGFATREPHVLHSHYMAVDPGYRRAGLGVELKRRQRSWCLERGITHMRWTYDPLQLGNAHLNLRVLGATGVEYHVDHYGTLGGINGSLPSD
ncbi:MAG: N-acylamino acid racemase, partial [Acidimicrobiaceae bacterium]